MKSVERILKTFNGEPTDRVPMFDFLFQKDIFEETTGIRPESYDNCHAIDCAKALHHDMVMAFSGGDDNFEVQINEKGEYKDEWGTTFVKADSAWPIDAPMYFPFHDWESYKKMKFPNPTAPGRARGIEAAIEKNQGELAIASGVGGPFTTLWSLMGPEELLTQMHTEPDFIKHVITEVTDYLIAQAKFIESINPDVFTIAEDLGASAGPLMSPSMFHEFVLPQIERLVKSVKKPIFFHCCGNINLFFDDLVSLGLACIHPLQRTAHMDLRTIKEKYGDRITLCGNVDSSRTLPYGTVEDVELETLACLEIGKPGGRYILASDHSLHDGISVENIKRMFAVGLEHGRYEL